MPLNPDLDSRLVVPPYMKQPDYHCAACNGPATGYYEARGVVMFWCDAHSDQVFDTLDTVTDAGFASGRGRLRTPWSYWLKAHCFGQYSRTRIRFRRVLRELRETRP